MMRHALVAATVWAGLAGAAFAQGAPTPQASPIIYPASASLAVSTVSAAGGVALPAPTLVYPAALAYNIGAAETFVALGTSSVTATTAGIPIEPGQCIPLWVGQSSQRGAAPTNIAAITASGTSTLRIVQATSLLACGGAPSAVTVSSPLPAPTITHGQTAALASSLILSASPAHLANFQVSADSTLSAAAWWIMIFDAVSAPADGAVTPAKCYAIPATVASATYGYALPPTFTAGITIAVSTTGCFTKTASSHAFIGGDTQ